MNRQPYPLSKEQRAYQELKDKEEKYNSLMDSLKLLLKDVEDGKDVKIELKNMIQYKRNYKSKISFDEWCDKNEYIAGFGRFSKDGESFPKSEIENLFYNGKRSHKL